MIHSLTVDILHYFVGTNSSDHQVNVVALSKVIIASIPTLDLPFFLDIGFPFLCDTWLMTFLNVYNDI